MKGETNGPPGSITKTMLRELKCFHSFSRGMQKHGTWLCRKPRRTNAFKEGFSGNDDVSDMIVLNFRQQRDE